MKVIEWFCVTGVWKLARFFYQILHLIPYLPTLSLTLLLVWKALFLLALPFPGAPIQGGVWTIAVLC